jgi:hypothetical protein
MDKKQELIEKITRMLEPYENIENYGFTINLYFKNPDNEYTNDHINISFNNSYSVCYPKAL